MVMVRSPRRQTGIRASLKAGSRAPYSKRAPGTAAVRPAAQGRDGRRLTAPGISAIKPRTTEAQGAIEPFPSGPEARMARPSSLVHNITAKRWPAGGRRCTPPAVGQQVHPSQCCCTGSSHHLRLIPSPCAAPPPDPPTPRCWPSPPPCQTAPVAGRAQTLPSRAPRPGWVGGTRRSMVWMLCLASWMALRHSSASPPPPQASTQPANPPAACASRAARAAGT